MCITPALASALAAVSCGTVFDLLHTMPRRCIDMTSKSLVAAVVGA